MEWVYTTGRSVDEAVDRALDMLGVDESDLEYAVEQAPKPGFLGRFGGADARIRARVRPISREKPGERRRRSKTSGSKGSGSKGSGSRDRRPRSDRAGGEEPRPAGGGSNGGRNRTRSKPAAAAKRRAPAEEATVNKSEVPIEDQAQAALEFAEGLVDAFVLDADVGYRIDDEEVIHLDVTGDDLGLLVGPKGATLSAIEELVRTVVQRRADGSGARIFVDVAGYRMKRREALAKFATSLGEKVLATGTVQVLDPMSASDRKVIHDAIAEMDGLETGSEGVDPRRHVVIRKA